MERNILLLIRNLSRRRINIGPHSSGKPTSWSVISTREQVECLPSASLSPTPAPLWASGTIRCTQPTWRALSLSSFRQRSGSFQNQRAEALSVWRRQALSCCVYIGVLGWGPLCRVTYSDRARWGQLRLDSLAVDRVSLELNLLLFLSFNRLVNRSHLPHFCLCFHVNMLVGGP